MKNITLIRHGESLGQTARRNGLNRKDPSLHDCYLSHKGIQQALDLRQHVLFRPRNGEEDDGDGNDDDNDSYRDFDLICTSPLSRAISTCILAMGGGHHLEEHQGQQQEERIGQQQKEEISIRKSPMIIVRADLCEIGSGIPENKGRDIDTVKKDLKRKLRHVLPNADDASTYLDHIDCSMLPSSWPDIQGDHYNKNNHDKKNKNNNKNYHNSRHAKNARAVTKVESFLQWLMEEREEVNIVVFCHYHVIRLLLKNAIDRVPNCTPIECILTEEGELILKSEYEVQDRGQQYEGKKKTKTSLKTK